MSKEAFIYTQYLYRYTLIQYMSIIYCLDMCVETGERSRERERGEKERGERERVVAVMITRKAGRVMCC